MDVEPKNPFDKPAPVLSGRIRLPSAYAGRIHEMFMIMNARQPVLEVFRNMMENPQA